MAKIVMLCSVSSSDGRTASVGDVWECSAAEAARYIEAGLATPTPVQTGRKPRTERAVAPEAETRG